MPANIKEMVRLSLASDTYEVSLSPIPAHDLTLHLASPSLW